MKFKENAIKPGMAIHCPKKEDARELLKYLDNRGYIWEDTFDSLLNNTRYEEGDTYFLDYDKKDNEYRVTHDSYDWAIENGYAPTEFSDLIELDELPTDSPMTAVEVLEWFHNVDADTIYKVFGISRLDEALAYYEPNEIIQRIEQHEAAKKAPKPVEVEWVDVCRIIQTKDDGTKEVVYEKNLKAETPFDEDPDLKEQTEAILKKYTLGHDGRYIAVIENICRVKEDK